MYVEVFFFFFKSKVIIFIQVEKCNNIIECSSHRDESHCIRNYDQTRYYWKEKKCIWHSLLSDIQGLPRWLSSYLTSSNQLSTIKLIRYYIMFILFLLAPILTLFGLLIMCCINCIDRFYSIPFAFVSFISLGSFICGAGGLGIFLYEWIQDRLYRPDYTYELNQAEALVIAFNPWLINIERLGIAFWLTVAAIGTTLFTTILSCCFCCGLQSERSKLRFHVDNDVYEIVQMAPYDD